MTNMNDVVSVIVVIAFIVIVFRKRIAPFFKGKKKPDKIGSSSVPESEASVSALHEISYRVVVFDVVNYNTDDLLSDVITRQLEKELSYIRTKGQVLGLDVFTMGRLLIFLIRWNDAGERT